MAYRNLMIESPARLQIEKNRLLITTDCQHTVPLEDICSVLLENRQSTVSVAALSQMAQYGITVFVCDEKHLPCGALLPFAQHSRNSGMIRLQSNLKITLQKQLWQQIIKGKIRNQANCLELLGKDDAAVTLRKLVYQVRTDDITNIEAQAANYYFQQLFPTVLYRRDDFDARNAFLNYGYAIIRGHVARLLVNYGFLPMLGLHHHSELNAYNLADDFMEPLRPVVDLYTASLPEVGELTTVDKRRLYNLLNVDMSLTEQNFTVAYAAEKMVQSFARCCQGLRKELLLPKLIPLQQHSYE